MSEAPNTTTRTVTITVTLTDDHDRVFKALAAIADEVDAAWLESVGCLCLARELVVDTGLLVEENGKFFLSPVGFDIAAAMYGDLSGHNGKRDLRRWEFEDEDGFTPQDYRDMHDDARIRRALEDRAYGRN